MTFRFPTKAKLLPAVFVQDLRLLQGILVQSFMDASGMIDSFILARS
jgi:hypothetical protein